MAETYADKYIMTVMDPSGFLEAPDQAEDMAFAALRELNKRREFASVWDKMDDYAKNDLLQSLIEVIEDRL